MTRNRKLLKLSFACGLRRSWRIECCVSISTDKRQIVSYSILFYSADKRLKVGQHLSLSLSLGYFCAVRTYRVVCAPLSSYRFVSSMMHIRESGVHVHVLKFSLFLLLLLLLLLLLFVPPFPLLSAFLFFFFFPAAACFFCLPALSQPWKPTRHELLELCTKTQNSLGVHTHSRSNEREILPCSFQCAKHTRNKFQLNKIRIVECSPRIAQIMTVFKKRKRRSM